MSPSLTVERKSLLAQRVQYLAWVTIAYNTLEGIVAILSGLAAGSVALVSFGLDSTIEVLSALAVAWQFSGGGRRHEEREERTRYLVAVAFLALAVYVAYESIEALIKQSHASASPVGIGLAIASLIVMPVLMLAKRRTGQELGSGAVVADSVQTLLCTYLSAVLLIGLVLNATLGWWWADPIAGLVIAVVALREANELRQGEDDCC